MYVKRVTFSLTFLFIESRDSTDAIYAVFEYIVNLFERLWISQRY